MRNKRLAALLLAFATPVQAQAPEPPAVTSGPLNLDQVLASSRFHAPQVLEAMARVRGAEGRLISTQAAFDTVFSSEVNTRVLGFYSGSNASAVVIRPLPDNGGYAYGGYRISSGNFPVYEDQYNTNQAG